MIDARLYAAAGLAVLALIYARQAAARDYIDGEAQPVADWFPALTFSPAAAQAETVPANYGAGILDQATDAISRTIGGYVAPSAAEVDVIDQEQNVQAFLMMIRTAEGTAGPNGYRTLFGGGLFDSFADHPRRALTFNLAGKPLTSTAAGAYQFLSTTWDDARRALGLVDFSPENQDRAAVWLIGRRRALDDVRAGRFEDAVSKCAREWASLPGSPYGQPLKTVAQVRAAYENAGGSYA